MFAERGIDAVSLREITAASGQRNKSAAQYHFGSKEQLVREIFERHTGRVNMHRRQLLAALYENGRQPTLEGLADALIHPLADTLIEHEHSHYARFLAQVATPPWTLVLVPADPAATESVRTVFSEIVRLLDDLPQAVLRTRLALAMMLTVRALAACEHAMEHSGSDNARRVALLTANLIDSAIGILRAPVSEATRRLLPRTRSRSPATTTGPGTFSSAPKRGSDHRAGPHCGAMFEQIKVPRENASSPALRSTGPATNATGADQAPCAIWLDSRNVTAQEVCLPGFSRSAEWHRCWRCTAPTRSCPWASCTRGHYPARSGRAPCTRSERSS